MHLVEYMHDLLNLFDSHFIKISMCNFERILCSIGHIYMIYTDFCQPYLIVIKRLWAFSVGWLRVFVVW